MGTKLSKNDRVQIFIPLPHFLRRGGGIQFWPYSALYSHRLFLIFSVLASLGTKLSENEGVQILHAIEDARAVPL